MSSILIVDDDELIRMSLGHGLECNGFICNAVENGAKALESLMNHDADVIFSDYQMPVMNGLEFLKSLPTMPVFFSPPVIFITGNFSEVLQQEAKAADAFVVLLKPYNTQMLINKALPVTRKMK